MKILALEFSSSRRSVAVVADGVVRGYAEAGLASSTPALALLDAALKHGDLARSEVQRIAIGLGPGSYTGVRMALSVAQGFAMVRDVEGVGVSSMLAMASDAPRLGVKGIFHVVVDAQRGEFYLGDYEAFAGHIVESGPVRIVEEEQVRRLFQAGEILLGPDLERVLPEVGTLYPDARIVGRLAGGVTTGSSVEALKPIYLRQTSFVKARQSRGQLGS